MSDCIPIAQVVFAFAYFLVVNAFCAWLWARNSYRAGFRQGMKAGAAAAKGLHFIPSATYGSAVRRRNQ